MDVNKEFKNAPKKSGRSGGRIELIVGRGVRSRKGQGGCERRIEVIVKMQKCRGGGGVG